jgi:hypothetical protein
MNTSVTLKNVKFRELVKACANDLLTVQEFNKLHACTLKCPITALTDPVFPLDIDDAEAAQVAWFVEWINHNHWQRLQAAVANIDQLHGFYNAKLAKREH